MWTQGEGSAKVGGTGKWEVRKQGLRKWGDAEWGREERRRRGMLRRRDNAKSRQEGADVAFTEVDTDATVPLSPPPVCHCVPLCAAHHPLPPPFPVALPFAPTLSLRAAPFLHSAGPHISQLSLPHVPWLCVVTYRRKDTYSSVVATQVSGN